jgi:hypothetical protein
VKMIVLKMGRAHSTFQRRVVEKRRCNSSFYGPKECCMHVHPIMQITTYYKRYSTEGESEVGSLPKRRVESGAQPWPDSGYEG